MSDPKHSGLSDNSLGAIAYITIIPAIAFLAIAPYNKSSFVRFHAWQSIVLNVAAVAISYALNLLLVFTNVVGPFLILGLTWLVWIAWVLLWLWCGIKALNGKRSKLPIIGNWAERQANR